MSGNSLRLFCPGHPKTIRAIRGCQGEGLGPALPSGRPRLRPSATLPRRHGGGAVPGLVPRGWGGLRGLRSVVCVFFEGRLVRVGWF